MANNNYNTLMKSKTFSLFLHRYIYTDENIIYTMKKIIMEYFNMSCEDDVIPINNVVIFAVKTTGRMITSDDVGNILLRFFKDALVQSKIMDAISTLKGESDLNVELADESFSVYNDIIFNNDTNIIYSLFNMYNVGEYLHIKF